MITGELKNKIDGIWDIFWSSGMTNPLTVIEQITYLMFIKILDDNECKKERNAAALETEVICSFLFKGKTISNRQRSCSTYYKQNSIWRF